MSITATINGSAVDLQAGVGISWRIGGRGTADVSMVDPASAPVVGQGISIYEDGVRIWSGTIDDIEKKLTLGGGVASYTYRLQCVSREHRLSFRLVKPAVTSADPSSTYMPLSGTCNTSGTSVVWVSGDKFDQNLIGTKIVVGGSARTVSAVSDTEHLTVSSSLSTATGVAFSWTPWAGNIVRSILRHWLQGEAITAGTIEDGDDVGKQVYDYTSVADIFQSLSEATDFIWYVTPDEALNFHDRASVTAGANISAADILDEESLSLTETREELVNARYQRISYNAIDPDAAAFEGDGTSKAFWLSAPIAAITAGSIQIGGQFFTAQFGLRDVDTGKDFYYSPGETKITQDPTYAGTVIAATNANPVEIQTAAPHGLASGHLVYASGLVGNTAPNDQWWRINVTDTDKFELIDCEGNGDWTSGGTLEANPALDPGDWLRFNYRRLGSDVIGYEDSTSISARAAVENSSGRYERIEESTDSVDAAGALTLAQAVVDAKKDPAAQFRMVTEKTGYRPGQLVEITAPDFGYSAESVLIEEVSARDIEDGKLRYSLSLVSGRVVGGWRKVFEALRTTRKSSSLAVISGGSVVGSGSGSGGSGGGTTVDLAGNVTILAPSSRINDDDSRDIIAPYLTPSPVGTFAGVVGYYEVEDQSNLPATYADGATTADGSGNAGGEWKPKQISKKEHVSGEPFAFSYPGPITAPVTVRIYLNSFNTAGVENELIRASETGETPSTTITLTPKSAGGLGEEYCQNPQNPAVDSNAAKFEGGVLVRRVKSSWERPEGCSGAYIEIIYLDENGNEQINVAVASGSEGENWFPDSKTPQTAKIRWRGFVDQFPGVEDDLVNTYSYLVTPEEEIEIGTGTGTVDLGEGIPDTVTPAMQVLNKVLGVATGGITEELIAIFAVSQDRLANAQIIDAARIVDAAVQNSKLASLSVDTSKLQTGSVDNDKLAALAVDAAKLASSAVTSTKIASAAVGSAAIAALAVGTAAIQDSSITTAKINNLAVQNAKIDALAVTSAKIGDSEISTAKIQDAAVTTAKIQNLAVTSALIADLAVSTAKIQDLAVTSAKIASLDVGKLTAGTIAAAVTMTSPTLVITGTGYQTNIDATSAIKISGTTGTGQYSQMTSFGLTVAASSGGSPFSTMNGSGINVNNQGFLYSDAVYLSGQQVVGPRKTAVSTVSYGIGPFPADSFTTGDRAVINSLITAVNAIINRMQSHGLIS